MENYDQKLEQLKKDNPIMKVSTDLGFVFKEKGTTVAVKCFNESAHSHGDKNPSLVLQPDTNSFECKSCGEKGDVFTLIQKIKGCEFKEAVNYLDPDFYRKKEEKPKPIDPQKYWKSRGITEDTKTKFNLKISEYGLDIPLPNGSVKRRNFKPYYDNIKDLWEFPKFRFVVSKGKCLFTAGKVSDIVYITEGELDAIKLHQDTGFTVVSDVTGASSFDKTYLEHPHIKDAKKIYIIPDNDEAGNKGALKTAEILGVNRCYFIELPEGKDVTEYFVNFKHTSDDFKSLVESATSMESLHTKLVSEYQNNSLDFSLMSDEEILHTEEYELLRFGIPKMDIGERAVGITPGWTIIAASQGIGKSWMMLHLTKVFYDKHNKRSVLLSLEMPKDALKERALQAYSELTQDQYKRGASVEKGIKFLKECNPIIQEFGLDDGSKITPDELTNIIDYWYSKGYRVFQFDHLHQISGMSDIKTANVVADKWSWAIKNVVDKYKDIWFIAYAQTNKDAATRPVKKEDIRYGSPFIDKCDMVFSLNNPAAMIEARKAAKQNLEEVYNPPSNRQIFIYLSKTRKLSVGLGGWMVYHSLTGNFVESEEQEILHSDDSLTFNRKSKVFAPLPDFSNHKFSKTISSSEEQIIANWNGKSQQELDLYLKNVLNSDEELPPEKQKEFDILFKFYAQKFVSPEIQKERRENVNS